MQNTHLSNSSKTKNEEVDKEVCTISKNVSNLGKENLNNLKQPAWKRRYVITIVAFLIFLILHIQRTVVGVLIVAMVNNTAISENSKAESESCQDTMTNSTKGNVLHNLRAEGKLLWSPQTQGYIFGSLYFGQLLSQIPAGILVERYGCKWFIVGTLLTSSILTILIPPFSWISATAVIIIQALRGIVMGVSAPCISILMSNWSPKSERGFLFSIVLTSFPLAPVLGSIFAGYISELPGGWPLGYYGVGGLGLLLGLYTLFFTPENPKEDSRISKAELNFILGQQETELSRKRPKLPWRQILTSIPVYAMMLGVFGRFWVMAQFTIVHATFLGTILHYPMGENGLFSALPNLFSFVSSHVASWISLYLQKNKIVSNDFDRKFWTFISSLGYSLCLVGMYIVGCDKNLSVILSILSMGLNGLGNIGCIVVSQDMSPTFSGTLHSINCTIGFLAGIIVPLLVGYLTNEMRTIEQWNKVFFISIGVVMTTSILFVVFGSAKIQPWNFVKEEREKNGEKRDESKSEKEAPDEMTRF